MSVVYTFSHLMGIFAVWMGTLIVISQCKVDFSKIFYLFSLSYIETIFVQWIKTQCLKQYTLTA